MKEFESHIQAGKPVVAEFFAEWSQPCQLMIPIMQEVKETIGDRATLIRINIDKDEGYAREYDVRTVPTVMIFKEGHLIWRKNGIAPTHEILEHLNLFME